MSCAGLVGLLCCAASLATISHSDTNTPLSLSDSSVLLGLGYNSSGVGVMRGLGVWLGSPSDTSELGPLCPAGDVKPSGDKSSGELSTRDSGRSSSRMFLKVQCWFTDWTVKSGRTMPEAEDGGETSKEFEQLLSVLEKYILFKILYI